MNAQQPSGLPIFFSLFQIGRRPRSTRILLRRFEGCLEDCTSLMSHYLGVSIFSYVAFLSYLVCIDFDQGSPFQVYSFQASIISSNHSKCREALILETGADEPIRKISPECPLFHVGGRGVRESTSCIRSIDIVFFVGHGNVFCLALVYRVTYATR